jgi:predicted nucleic-acid-binding Zn-ribbon protein
MCPKCQSRKLWNIDEVWQPQEETANGVRLMRVAAMAHPKREQREGWYWGNRRIDAGRFEAWVCAECGFTELYAKGANAALAEMASIPGSGVRLIDTTPERGPFR